VERSRRSDDADLSALTPERYPAGSRLLLRPRAETGGLSRDVRLVRVLRWSNPTMASRWLKVDWPYAHDGWIEAASFEVVGVGASYDSSALLRGVTAGLVGTLLGAAAVFAVMAAMRAWS
jgi:hypothetical protein